MEPIPVVRVRALLAEQVARFCEHRDGLDVVGAALARGVGLDDVVALRDLLPGGGEAGLFAAMALATVGDDAGLALLRAPHQHFMTNSCVELGLALCARLAVGDAAPPLSFLNASMLGELAVVVGAFPPRAR